MGFLDEVKNALLAASHDEPERQKTLHDADYISPGAYLFDLRVEGSPGFLLPLALPPQGINLAEPFALEVTPTQAGGIFVEEQGIMQRRLRIRGTTGFWPTPLPGSAGSPGASSGTAASTASVTKSFFREVDATKTKPALSGMRHLELLQDKIFRAYGDLKRNATTAPKVSLRFHDMQAREHWLVSPVSFTVDRNSQDPLSWPYEIELLILDKADKVPFTESVEAGLFATIRNGVAKATATLDSMRACVQDVAAVQHELRMAVHSIDAVARDTMFLIDDVSRFLAGTTQLIRAPYATLFAIADAWESVLQAAYEAVQVGRTVADFPGPIKNRFSHLVTLNEQMGLLPQYYASPTTPQRRTPQSATASTTGSTSSPLSAPTSLSAAQKLGSGALTSDVTLAKNQAGAAANKAYGANLAYTIAQGDTLVSLAAKFLGDPMAWVDIAQANGMRPPIIPTEAALPLYTDEAPPSGLLFVGRVIQIPQPSGPTATADGATPATGYQQNPAVLGAAPTSTLEEQLYGRDLSWQSLDGNAGAIDLCLVDHEGLPDLGTVSGTANVVQASALRILTEAETAPLARELGLQGMIGTGIASADLQSLTLRVSQALGADPRIAKVGNVSMSYPGGGYDAIRIDAFVTLVGASSATQVSVSA